MYFLISVVDDDDVDVDDGDDDDDDDSTDVAEVGVGGNDRETRRDEEESGFFVLWATNDSTFPRSATRSKDSRKKYFMLKQIVEFNE